MSEIIKSKYHYQAHTGQLTHATSQPTEDIILERNKELRKNKGALKDLSFGRKVADVPVIMMEKAVRDGYDLYSRDADIAGKEMMRFLQSEEGKKCLVQEKL